MDLNYPEECYSREETNYDMIGTGRSYECIFCERGFTKAQALGGHMNIHRKERANKSKPTSPSLPKSSNKVDGINNYADFGFCLQISGHSTTPDASTDREALFPATAQSIRPSLAEVLCVENQRGHVFAQDWLKSNLPLCFGEFKDKSEENGLDLELKLGHHP